jgi:hypothetical protein
MAIPTPPPNTSKATAIALEWQDNQNRYYYIQSTSTLGYNRADPPPDPIPPPIYYDIWFKAQNAVLCRGSVTAHNLSQGSTAPSIVTVFDENDNILGEGPTAQFEPVAGNLWYYFRIHTPDNVPEADVVVDIIANIVSGGPVLSASIVNQPEETNQPLTIVIGTAQSFNFIRHVANNSNPTDTNHPMHGKCGDILPSGETCIEDRAIKGVTIRNKYYGAPLTELGEDGSISVPLGLVNNDDLYYIRRNADGRNFWLSYKLTGVPIVRSIAVTGGVLGPVFDLGGLVIAMCAVANRVLYYTIESDAAVVRRWDLVNNRRLIDLTPVVSRVKDIIVTSAGDVLVLYIDPTNAHVYRYNSITGTIITVYKVATINGFARINYYGANPNHFVIWTRGPVNGVSNYYTVILATGQVAGPIVVKEFNANNGYINVADLYEKKQGNVYIGPTQRVGPGPSSNFWIQPVTSRGGCYVPAPPIWDDEFIPPVFPPYEYPVFPPEGPPGGVYPYPPDPPETIPPIPIQPPPPAIVNPANIGGGLIVIDPSNAIRHDVYMDKTGTTLQASIIAYIRTAFLGD